MILNPFNQIICLLFYSLIFLSFVFNSESVISTNSPIILLENKALNIICNNTDNNRPTEWIWKKDGIVYDDFPPESKERIKIDAKDNSIFINKASKEDIGVWVCEQKGSGSIGSTGPISAEIKVVSKPWLMPFEEFQKTNYKSANIVEGQRFHLNCKVIEGYDRDATIKWYRFNESDANNENRVLTDLTEQPNSRIRIERLNDTEQTLTIEKVAPNDRFFYVCSATNGFLTFNNTILLRVKDKLGALWPFLAIVAEVVILCTIIFIYEKRRIKPDFDDTENDNNTEPKAAQDSTAKTQDVRQRK